MWGAGRNSSPWKSPFSKWMTRFPVALERFCLAHGGPLLGAGRSVRCGSRDEGVESRRTSPLALHRPSDWVGLAGQMDDVATRRRADDHRPAGRGEGASDGVVRTRSRRVGAGPWAPNRRESPAGPGHHQLGELDDASRGDPGHRPPDPESRDDVAAVVTNPGADAAQALVVLLVVDRIAAFADPLQLCLQPEELVMVLGVYEARPFSATIAATRSRGRSASRTLPRLVAWAG